MKVKYSDEATPLRNKHSGYTFIPSGYGNPVLSGQKSGRYRYILQHLRMQCNQKAITNWRNMSEDVKSAWSAFASDFPQPSKKDPNVFLTGYQLFVKRNTYEFLHEGINAPFVEFPELVSLPNPTFSASIGIDGMCLDVTEWYSRNFGILPNVGDYLLCRILPMAEFSGQFFAPYVATLEVTEVFIDGVFLTLNFTGSAPGIVFSVYLSRPVRAGRSYTDTKYRYMGCFKPTQFVQLTDTPEDYTGESGKFVAVKSDESGLEFVEAGGGSFDCSDLEDCDQYQSIVSNIELLNLQVSALSFISIPAVNFGLLYNGPAVVDSKNLAPAGWHVLTKAELDSISTALGGDSVSGGKLKETGFIHWNSPNTGATNSSKLNFRGGGNITSSGSFSSLKVLGRFYTSTSPSTSRLNYGQLRNTNDDLITYNNLIYPYGCSVRLVKDSTDLVDGETGSLLGNNNRVYRTMCINGIEIMADNLCETLFRDGSPITKITSSGDWASYSDSHYCAYDFDNDNV